MKLRARLALTLCILCAAQLVWFVPKTRYAVGFDGMAYNGIASTIRAGRFMESLDAFRSPLISWMIALVFGVSVLQAGKLITLLSFLLACVSLYVFTFELWHSDAIAATAVALLLLARGLTFFAIALVTPDYLFALIVLLYFTALLRSLRADSEHWWKLGLAHGAAFLAKAIALPWLTMCTLVAIFSSSADWKGRTKKFLSALAIPFLVAACWAIALHSKYGVFTTGSQFKMNLLQWTLRGTTPPAFSKFHVLRDISPNMSEYCVYDPMPPGAWEWKYHFDYRTVIFRTFVAETRNIPFAMRELLVLMTPGIPLAFFALLPFLWKSPKMRVERMIAVMIMVDSLGLVLAYAMLVIDSRYFFPLIPLWFAIGAKFLWPEPEITSHKIRCLCVGMVFAGTICTLTYWASPFRVQTRDWTVICRAVGDALAGHGTKTVVSVGSGPFPEHGVGWEAGYFASYYGNTKLIATLEQIPQNLDGLHSDIARASSDAVLIWETDEQRRNSVRQMLAADYPSQERIIDPQLGEVGLVLYAARSSSATSISPNP
jgi:hypothetical protein